MSKIKKIHAREVLDSRGNPTIEVEVTTESGAFGRAIVPSGASTGSREALELRDGDKTRFNGKGVLMAVDNVNLLLNARFKGCDVLKRVDIDNRMLMLDGTEFKTNIGANAILGVSLTVAKAAADYKKMPLYKYLGKDKGEILPIPMLNVVNGGAHANSSVDFQEYMIMPIGATNFKHAVQMASEIFSSLKKILISKGYSTGVGDEGGFAPNFKSNEEPIEMITEAIKSAGYKPKNEVVICLDVAATEFYNKETREYQLVKSGQGSKTSDEMISWYQSLIKKYPIVSIEDGLAEDDWAGWARLTKKLGKKIQLVGDDLFVTNPKILQEGINKGVANAILIKPNQIGTLSETIKTIELAKQAGYGVVISHRSGETEDVTIADLAVAVNAGQIKTGSICRTDRVAKYNQLIRIEEELGKRAKYGK